MTQPPERERPPWWSANDEQFAGATPLFDGSDAEGAESAAAGSAPSDASADGSGSAGSAITEALRLAAAVTAWSNESGLTDTLREIANEATETLSAMASGGETTSEDGSTASTSAANDTQPSSADSQQWFAHQTVCDYCPLCRGLDVMRTVQPQMSQGLAESMASVTTALNSALESLAARNRPR